MSNYLKKILFTLLILGIPYMNSASKAMDVEGHEGAAVRARKVSFVTEDQKDFQSKHSTPSQVVSLEDSKVSWTSYLSSSVISAVQKAYDVVDYTTRNPQKAAIIGVFLTYQITAVAATCKCSCIQYPDAGCVSNALQCAVGCHQAGWNFSKCVSTGSSGCFDI